MPEMLNDGDAQDPARPGAGARTRPDEPHSQHLYTQWYWKTDLHNLLNFLSLRQDAHAQFEIRAYAIAMLETVRAWVPLSFQAFADYRLHAATLSAQMLAALRRMLAGEVVEQAGSGLSKREWVEFQAILQRNDAAVAGDQAGG